jgi:hypothetical protein
MDQPRLLLGVRRVLDDCIAAWIEDRLVAVVPPHAVVRVACGSENLEDLADTTGLAQPASFDDDQIADVCT